jgi:hypothetical protein
MRIRCYHVMIPVHAAVGVGVGAGYVTRQCLSTLSGPIWDNPDYTGCVSKQFSSLAEQVCGSVVRISVFGQLFISSIRVKK